jgi:hypothetical protein
VDYTSFTNFERADLEKISLEDHINVILALCIDRLAVEIENDSSLLNKLDWTKKESLDWFFNKYHPNESTLVEKKIKGIISFCKRQIDYILGKNISRRNLENLSNFDLLIQLRDLIRETGFRSIYIIVDKLDENGLRNFSYIDMSKFISPVLTSLNYLQLENVATKLFIPIQIRNVLGPNIRSDRIDTITIRWDNRRLWEMLEKRLNAFSEGEQNSLRPFVEPDLIDYFETNILFYSANNPRNLIRLIKEIISELCENDPDPMYISKLAINNGIRKFYDDRRAEADSDMYMDMLMKNAANFEGKELYDVPEHI